MFNLSFGTRLSDVKSPGQLKSFDKSYHRASVAQSNVEEWLDGVDTSSKFASSFSSFDQSFTRTGSMSGPRVPACPFPSFSWPVSEPTLEARPADGFGTNETSPEFGAAGTFLSRLAPDSFIDGGDTLAGADRRVRANSVTFKDPWSVRAIVDDQNLFVL